MIDLYVGYAIIEKYTKMTNKISKVLFHIIDKDNIKKRKIVICKTPDGTRTTRAEGVSIHSKVGQERARFTGGTSIGHLHVQVQGKVLRASCSH